MSMSNAIEMPPLCERHVWLLIHQAGYKESDPWRALLIASSIVLFQAMTCDDTVTKRTGGDVHKLSTLGCPACYKPDAFGEVVEVAKMRDLGRIKALGEKWIAEATAR